MIHITDKVQCCGCNACGDVCAKGAITFRADEEGFWYPEVNAERCVDCGLCEKVCPVINIGELKKNDLPQSVCYAAEHKNLEVVFDSTSGGLFSALADRMYRDRGFVGGAVFNEDFSVSHFISNDKADLPRLRSSKYLQSSLQGFYRQVQTLLKAGEKVLVCGGPCQMAALRAFLRKDYENLIIADYICRGINSPKVWYKYLRSFEERYGSKVVYSKAKSKEYGWRNLTQKMVLANGKAYYETKSQNNFGKLYLRTGVFCRPSCYDCKFKGYPRIADITLADFWGIERVDRSLDKNLGTSLVMVNSKKGEAFFEQVKPRINCVQVPFESIEAGNRSLKYSLEPPKVDRTQFFRDLDTLPFDALAGKYVGVDKMGKRERLRRIKDYIHLILHTTQCRIKPLWQFFHYNSWSEIMARKVIIPTPHSILQISKSAKVVKHGITVFGKKKYRSSHLETRLLVEDGASLELGTLEIADGADIEVFRGAKLRWLGGGANMHLTIVCGHSIEIGNAVSMGRSILIRDNNGGHYMNRNGYRDSRPIVIGDKVWLCERATIMPGVKIGDGAIVGACSLVVNSVHANTLVSGNPAVVADTDILWKF